VNVLTKRLFRNFIVSRGQFLAITAVIMVGVTVYVSMISTCYNMTKSADWFYHDYNFADYYFHIVKAPQGILRQIEAVPGVNMATGRIQKDVTILMENGERGTARLTSFPLPVENAVNRPYLLSGSLFKEGARESRAQVLLDPKYAQANNLSKGGTVTVIAEGREVQLDVIGTATSPEFIYTVKDAASFMPDSKGFGVFMITNSLAEDILDLSGQVNQVIIKLAPGADEKKVSESIKDILQPYGLLASYPRKDQFSAAILDGELGQLRNSAVYFSSIFLGIAALIELVMLGRMVKIQRLQIGTMKAIGYSSFQIMLHYTEYALAIGLLGLLLGIFPGIFFSASLSKLYASYFNLPVTVGGVNLQAIFYSIVLTLGVSAAAGLAASRGVLGVRPAESMRPVSPGKTGKVFLERWTSVWERIDLSWKMCLRSVNRNRFRTAVTVLGVMFATGLLVLSLFINDTYSYMLDTLFSRDQLYDYFVRFDAPVKETELLAISRLDAVTRAEPVLEAPVKIKFGSLSRDEVIMGMLPDAELKRIWDSSGRPLFVSGEGLLISESTARKLGVKKGASVQVETLLGMGPLRVATLKIAGINSQFIGGVSYTTLEQLNGILQEKNAVSGAMLKVAPGRSAEFEKNLSGMNRISSIISRSKELEGIRSNLGYMFTFVFIMVAFAVILGFAIVYNASVISFAERKREMGFLRVLGYRVNEVSGLLLKENLLQTVFGVLVGLPFGRLISGAYIYSATRDEVYSAYSMQIVIYPLTYIISAASGVLFIAIAYWLAVKNIIRLDLVEVLKARD